MYKCLYIYTNIRRYNVPFCARVYVYMCARVGV